MARICYVPKTFSRAHQKTIEQADAIMAEYSRQGFDLTLRQLYYQFVARDLIPNSLQSYKRLGSIVNDARLAGELDWNQMVDRTRYVRKPSTWDDPASIIQSAASSYAIDLWADQDRRVEVWIEKDALVGVIEGVCQTLQVPFFSCRGYTSQSEAWRAGRRLRTWRRTFGQEPLIIHLGDHDPSGVDMTRDVAERLNMFAGFPVEVRRIALNMDQVEEYGPPPNPAKLSDSRADGYIQKFGSESWELDALEPSVLTALIRSNVEDVLDDDKFQAKLRQMERERKQLQAASENWNGIVESFVLDEHADDDQDDGE